MSRNHFVSGEFNVTCDVCSKKIKAHQARQRWDGFIVCPDDYETRHPQDFVQAKQDKISVPFQRPIPTLLFTTVPYNIYWDSQYTQNNYIVGDDTI